MLLIPFHYLLMVKLQSMGETEKGDLPHLLKLMSRDGI